MIFKTSNPVFNSYFWNFNSKSYKKMVLKGIILKTIFGLLVVMISALYVWRLKREGQDVSCYFYGGMIIAVIASVLTSYKQDWALITVPIYAIAKGSFLGAITTYSGFKHQNLAQKAILYSLISFFVMLVLYQLNFIKVSKKLRSILYTIIATIFTIYFISFIFRFFGIRLGFIYDSSWLSIVFTAIVIAVAAFSLLLDFDYISRYINKAPKEKEWIAVWGLLVTLIWMYIEIFRLFKKITNRQNLLG